MPKTLTSFILFSGLLVGANALCGQTAISQKRVDEVVSHLESHSDLIDSFACVFNENPIPVLAVVGPEWVRYSMVRDLMETKALEMAYVHFGTKAADFSIGPFQMKPSFIESLEKAGDLPPSTVRSMAYSTSNPVAQRRARIYRMKDIRWQFFYAFAFYSLAKNRFADLLPAEETRQIAFIASAYNLGFTRPASAIEKWKEAEVFPYGSTFRGPQESYSRVALRFYDGMRARRGKIW